MGLITDPGSGLQDLIDDAKLSGTTGVHNRFKTVFDEFNGNIEVANLKTKTGGGSTVVLSEYPTFSKGFKVYQHGLITNARLSLSAGRLKLVGADGNDPASDNPVVFYIPSSTAGALQEVVFTSTTNCFIDDSTTADSYFRAGSGSPLGTTAGVAWGNDLPVGIYVTYASSTPLIFLSRTPNFTTVPSNLLYLGYKNTPPGASNSQNVFGWSTSSIDAFASAPCALVGSVRLTKNSSDDWTFTALDSGDGFGEFYNFGQRPSYIMPDSQNGAASGSYFSVSAGTAPTYFSSFYRYKIDLAGTVLGAFSFSNSVGGTAGAGANPLTLSLPFTYGFASGEVTKIFNSGSLDTVGVIYSGEFFYQSTIATARTRVSGAQQNNASREITGHFISFLTT